MVRDGGQLSGQVGWHDFGGVGASVAAAREQSCSRPGARPTAAARSGLVLIRVLPRVMVRFRATRAALCLHVLLWAASLHELVGRVGVLGPVCVDVLMLGAIAAWWARAWETALIAMCAPGPVSLAACASPLLRRGGCGWAGFRALRRGGPPGDGFNFTTPVPAVPGEVGLLGGPVGRG